MTITKWPSGNLSFFSTLERIAKKILLEQIKADYSSGDEISSDEESQEDESELEGDEGKQSSQDNETDENGKSCVCVAFLSCF